MKFVPLLLMASLLLGTCFTIHAEAQEKSKSKSEQKKTPTSKKVSEKQLESWINQLSEGSFRERRAASNNLMKAGKQSLPVLVKGAQKNNAELSKRCVEIVVKMYRGKNGTLKAAVAKALGELEKSSNRMVAQRAVYVIQLKLKKDAIAAINNFKGTITFDNSDKVRSVSLSGPQVTDADLVHLTCFPKLDELSLFDTEITDAGLVILKGMTKLKSLWLNNKKVTDAGLIHLAGLTSLINLDLSNTKISDAGLVHMKGMTKLETLRIDNTKVTDAGLVHLMGMTKLRTLILSNTQVTEEGMKKLKIALPKCRIHR